MSVSKSIARRPHPHTGTSHNHQSDFEIKLQKRFQSNPIQFSPIPFSGHSVSHSTNMINHRKPQHISIGTNRKYKRYILIFANLYVPNPSEPNGYISARGRCFKSSLTIQVRLLNKHVSRIFILHPHRFLYPPAFIPNLSSLDLYICRCISICQSTMSRCLFL